MPTKKQLPHESDYEDWLSDEKIFGGKKVDRNSRDLLPSPDLKFLDSGTVTSTSENLARAMVAFADTHGIPEDQKLEFLADAFAKAAQISELGTTLLSEEELTAPPKITWKARDKSLKHTPVEHCEIQFEERIGRGLTRSHIAKADPSAGNALKRWLSSDQNQLPENWLGGSSKFAVRDNIINKLQYLADLRSGSYSSVKERKVQKL